MTVVRIKTHYYQQFDADYSLDVPGEGYGGWKSADLELSLDHTALVVMHAWDCGTPEQFPGWYRCVEYIPRANDICRKVFPPLLSAVRRSGLNVFHVIGAFENQLKYPGYQSTEALAPVEPYPRVDRDPIRDRLDDFHGQNVFVGPHNESDVSRGFERLDFAREAMPIDGEAIAQNSPQLYTLCKKAGVNHLIYIGFAINWCLLISPGGMTDMVRYGLMCSAVRDATTAVENKETARAELGKAVGLWRVAVGFGYVYESEDLIASLESAT